MKTKLKYRYTPPILTLALGAIISTFFKLDIDSQLVIRFIGMEIAIFSVIYIILISFLQLLIKNNNFLIPTCLLLVSNLLYLKLKIQHYPGQTETLIIGNTIVIISFYIGVRLNKKLPTTQV